jgi:O-antigen/teichoic acid export membrane protein
MALAGGAIVERSLRFVRYVILARILAPDQFGLMALVMVAASALEALTEVGIKQSVIQNKRGADPEYLNVAWWFQAVRGMGLFAFAFLAAPWISSFYERPELLRLLRVAFLAVLFRGFISPRAYVLEKQYRFGVVVFLIQGSGILGAVITIVSALIIRNVWALVIGFVSEFAIMCVLSYVFVPFLPRFKMERGCLGELMEFARGMFGVPVLTMIAFETDVLVLGKVVTKDELGMYYLAMTLVLLPITLFGRVITPILLPAFSEKQDDREALRRVLLRVVRSTAVFTVPLVAFMASCAGGVLAVVYGSEYAAVTIPCTVLCLLIVCRTQAPIFNSAYLAVGQPRMNRRFVVLRAAIVGGLIYPAIIHFGLLGAAVVAVLGNSISLLMQVFWSRRIVDLEFRAYARCFLPGLVLALPIIAMNLLRLSGIESPFVALGLNTAVFCGSWVGGALLLIK